MHLLLQQQPELSSMHGQDRSQPAQYAACMQKDVHAPTLLASAPKELIRDPYSTQALGMSFETASLDITPCGPQTVVMQQ